MFNVFDIHVFSAVAEQMNKYRSSHILRKTDKDVPGKEGSVRKTCRVDSVCI